MTGTAPELISTTEAATVLRCHRNTLILWEKAGRIRSVRPGGPRGRRWFRRADVEALLHHDEGAA